MNNYQWLLQMDGAERKAWFDAEHVETEERALDGDTAAQYGDSRDQIIADVRKYFASEVVMPGEEIDNPMCMIHLSDFISMLDRQAAITEREVEHDLMKSGRMAVEVERERIKKLTAECDKLTNAINELQKKQPYCYDPFVPLDTLSTIGRYIDELKAERDEYRVKFGKCIDYADAIHALMDDEGMA